jgi:hypothetical protein
MLDLEHDLKGLCRRNRDGSRMTQAQREQRLRAAARQLDALGYKHLRAHGIKPKHVEALVREWQAAELSPATIKNRMADLRWWCEHTGKPEVMARSNDAYRIEHRSYVTNENKARELTAAQLDRVQDSRVAMSLRLEEQFGLRREEAIKIVPTWADRGDRLVLKSSWTKGGRPREVPIRTPEQRRALEQAHTVAGDESLIPPEDRYIDQRRRYERECSRAGIDRAHGLRHAYAQRRYAELTGWQAPTCGGPGSKQLNPVERELDQHARQIISRELGHERIQITAIYLGR